MDCIQQYCKRYDVCPSIQYASRQPMYTTLYIHKHMSFVFSLFSLSLFCSPVIQNINHKLFGGCESLCRSIDWIARAPTFCKERNTLMIEKDEQSKLQLNLLHKLHVCIRYEIHTTNVSKMT